VSFLNRFATTSGMSPIGIFTFYCLPPIHAFKDHLRVPLSLRQGVPRKMSGASTPRQNLGIAGSGSYHDRANSILAVPVNGPYSNHRTTFPEKLFQLLDGADAQGLSHIISWQPHGRCFLVRDREAFKNLLPTLMPGLTKWKSFQRQLHLWGFTRLTNGPDYDGYFHEYFLRYRPHLLPCIQRTMGRRAERPGDEPNFDTLPFITPLTGVQVQATRRDETQQPGYSIEATTHLPLDTTHHADDSLHGDPTLRQLLEQMLQDSESVARYSDLPNASNPGELDTNYGRGNRQRSDDEMPPAHQQAPFSMDVLEMLDESDHTAVMAWTTERESVPEGQIERTAAMGKEITGARSSFGISDNFAGLTSQLTVTHSNDPHVSAHLHGSLATRPPDSTSALAEGGLVSEISISLRSNDVEIPRDWDLEPRPIPPVIMLQGGVRRPLYMSVPVAQHPSFAETSEQEFEYIGTRGE
jgi:HSF-type DNA-binding